MCEEYVNEDCESYETCAGSCLEKSCPDCPGYVKAKKPFMNLQFWPTETYSAPRDEIIVAFWDYIGAFRQIIWEEGEEGEYSGWREWNHAHSFKGAGLSGDFSHWAPCPKEIKGEK